MNVHAEREVRRPLAETLRELMPYAEFDVDEAAKAIVERADLAALDFIEAREEAYEAALVAAMNYMSGRIAHQRAAIGDLEDQVRMLTLRLAAKPRFVAVPATTKGGQE